MDSSVSEAVIREKRGFLASLTVQIFSENDSKCIESSLKFAQFQPKNLDFHLKSTQAQERGVQIKESTLQVRERE